MAKKPVGNRLTPGSRTPFLDFATDVSNFGARKTGRAVRGVGRGVGAVAAGGFGLARSAGEGIKNIKSSVRGAPGRFENRLWGGRSVPLNARGENNAGVRQQVDMSRSGLTGRRKK